MTDAATTRVVLAERRGAVALLTLNRPDRLNAWSDDLEQQYFALLQEADADPEVRAIVVTGAGRGFCAGRDMSDLERESQGTGPEVPEGTPRTYPLTGRKPLIAALNGAAAGIGLVEALYCDVRFCVPQAKLTTSFARRGLIAEYGLSWILPRLVGVSRALDLLLSGRIVLGEEAHRIGLVDRLVEPDRLVDEAVAYATDLAENCSPTSMMIMKDQVQRHLDVDFATALADSERLLEESFQRPDVEEGVQSYLERRPPHFPPLPPRS
jgi:enoyl-CoA hydratase/carnithine racemase